MARLLTALGCQQAEIMAGWLRRHLNSNTRILVSPALRCQQTASALGLPYELKDELLPEKTADDLIGLLRWPESQQAVLIVGHQPVLSQVVMRLLACTAQDWSFRKGAVHWLRSRERHGRVQTVLVTVQSPDLL